MQAILVIILLLSHGEKQGAMSSPLNLAIRLHKHIQQPLLQHVLRNNIFQFIRSSSSIHI